MFRMFISYILCNNKILHFTTFPYIYTKDKDLLVLQKGKIRKLSVLNSTEYLLPKKELGNHCGTANNCFTNEKGKLI